MKKKSSGAMASKAAHIKFLKISSNQWQSSKYCWERWGRKNTNFLSSDEWLEIVFYFDFKRIWIMYCFERIKSKLDLIWIMYSIIFEHKMTFSIYIARQKADQAKADEILSCIILQPWKGTMVPELIRLNFGNVFNYH